MMKARPSKPFRYSPPARLMKLAAEIQSAAVAMPLNRAGTRRPAT